MALIALICVAGCKSPLDFGSDFEATGLTYAEYASEMGTHYVDPVGGSDIDVRIFCTRDTSDFWLKATVEPADFDALVQSHRWHNRLAEPPDAGIPVDWPSPQVAKPTWWQPPTATPQTKVIVCETRDRQKSGGEYWQYDAQSQTLWVFDWYQQWGEFGPDRPKPEQPAWLDSLKPGDTIIDIERETRTSIGAVAACGWSDVFCPAKNPRAPGPKRRSKTIVEIWRLGV